MLGNLEILDLLNLTATTIQRIWLETPSSCYYAVYHRDFVVLLTEKIVKEREKD
jgi:hypothetical protein